MDRVTPFTASSTPKRSQRPKRNGWSVKWSDELKIKVGQSAWVLLTKGDYRLDDGSQGSNYERAMYKVQCERKRKDGTSYQAWPYYSPNEGDCTLTTAANSEHARVTAPFDGKPNRFFMNVLQFGVFRKTPVLDDAGAPLRYSRGKLQGQEIYRWEPIESLREKKRLLNGGAGPDELCFFRKKFIELPKKQFEILRSFARRAEEMCFCGGKLFPVVYHCQECEEVLLDVEDTDLSEDEVRRFGDESLRCRGCGAVNYPKPVSECDNCNSATPLRFTEVVAELTKVRSGDGYPTLTITRMEPITEFQFADGGYAVIRDEEGGPLIDPDSDGNGFVLDEDLEKLAMAQYDFADYTSPKSNGFYSDLLDLREGQPGFCKDSVPYGNFRE